MLWNLNSILIFFTLVVNLFLAGVIFWEDRRSVMHRTLSLFIFSIALWNASSLMVFNQDFILSNTGARMGLVFAMFIPSAYLLFAYSFLNPGRPIQSKVWLAAILPLAVLLPLSTGDLNTAYSYYADRWHHLPGLLYIPFSLWFVLSIGTGLSALIRTGRAALDPVLKSQIRLIVIGTLISGISGLFFNSILELAWRPLSYDLGTPLSIVLPVLISFAILRYRLLDMRVLIQKRLITLGFFAGAFAVMSTIMITLSALFHNLLDIPEMVTMGIAVFFIAFTYPLLQPWSKRFVNRFMKQETFDFGGEADQSQRSVVREPQIGGLTYAIAKEVEKILNVPAVMLLVRDEAFRSYVSDYPQKFEWQFTFEHPFIQGLEASDCVVMNVKDARNCLNLHGDGGDRSSKVLTLFKEHGTELIVSLKFGSRMIGVLLLPRRRDEQDFDHGDLIFLKGFFRNLNPYLCKKLLPDSPIVPVRVYDRLTH